jgi:predicted outer membrane repeat protein
VIVATPNTTGIYIDGFTITAGNANSESTVTYNGQSVNRNDGGGMIITGGLSLIYNCTFTGNVAFAGGGALFENGSAVSYVFGDVFSGNTAGYGGAVRTESIQVFKAINTIFTGNTSFVDGGGGLESLPRVG